MIDFVAQGYKTLIITKRGENILEWIQRNDGKPRIDFTVHKFAIESNEQANAIINHPTFAGWKYGISIGMSKL